MLFKDAQALEPKAYSNFISVLVAFQKRILCSLYIPFLLYYTDCKYVYVNIRRILKKKKSNRDTSLFISLLILPRLLVA